ncbi:TPA: anti-repressor SinI family protein [Bacillus anthracis]|uniref:SinI protein n=1 Tax=Bacillus anthracis TaxID=1392 RepID=A0A640LF05_BACAN|nr:anti-repressor SinI family protein [Bacillus anthracis]EXJ21058.1 SinI protein [Bacillus anthracis str. 95014]AJM79956.1 SinI anti-repressor domain-containing protein [Bacillus anthracis]KEY95370.1 SinI anti-repressor domain-containing protein [Bacillus anthracis str. Carbosap]GET98457.1 SinI protein [Bacillus anthracis]GET99514.1 SinI protein [Bacillus anthracis]
MYKDKTDALDQEWIDLILETLDAGIALQDIEHFFKRMKPSSQAQ